MKQKVLIVLDLELSEIHGQVYEVDKRLLADEIATFAAVQLGLTEGNDPYFLSNPTCYLSLGDFDDDRKEGLGCFAEEVKFTEEPCLLVGAN